MRDDFSYRAFLDRDRLVHIVDADPAACEALDAALRREGFVTSFSLDARSLASALWRGRPDAVIISLRAGTHDGLAMLRRIKARHRGIAVFVVQDGPHVETAVRAMKAGAADVLIRPFDHEHLVALVRGALRHSIHVDTIQHGRHSDVPGFMQLTPRERQVLQLIADGQSNKEAGRELGISPRTIETHRARLMDKLGARNTADLMRIVLTD